MKETKLEQVHRLFRKENDNYSVRLPSKLKDVRDTVNASCGSFIHTVQYMNGDYLPHYPMPALRRDFITPYQLASAFFGPFEKSWANACEFLYE